MKKEKENTQAKRKKLKLKKRVIMKIIGLIGGIFSLILFLSILKLNLLPDKYLLLLGFILLIIVIVIFVLVNIKTKLTHFLGIFLTVLDVLMCSVGIYYISRTTAFLDQSFSKKVTTTTTYYIVTKSGNSYQEDDIEGDVYYYNNFDLKDVKKSLADFDIHYVECESMIQLFNDIKDGVKNFMLIDKANYSLAFELDTNFSSEDYQIVYFIDSWK